MLLAGDIGGTKTLLGIFDVAPERPRPLAVRVFATLDYDELPAMIGAFLKDGGVMELGAQGTDAKSSITETPVEMPGIPGVAPPN